MNALRRARAFAVVNGFRDVYLSTAEHENTWPAGKHTQSRFVVAGLNAGGIGVGAATVTTGPGGTWKDPAQSAYTRMLTKSPTARPVYVYDVFAVDDQSSGRTHVPPTKRDSLTM